MKPLITTAFLGALIVATPIQAQDQSLKEKISDTSPDKRFALRISYDPAIDDGSGDSISNEAVKSVDIIALPGKTVVTNLSNGEIVPEGGLVWASDSKWFACGFSEGHRVTDTGVYHLKDDKFDVLETDEMTVPSGGDPRNQYVTPMRWLKPGTLVLNQFTIFYHGKGDSTFQFTVRFDDKGKFHVIDKKRVRTKEE